MSSNGETNKNTINMPYQNKDALLKNLTDYYPSPFLKILSLFSDGRKYEQKPSEIVLLEHNRMLTDKVFMSDDGVILHLEFDSSGKARDLARYMHYAASLSYQYSFTSEPLAYHPVKTVIIFPGYVTPPTKVYTTVCSLQYSVEHIYLADLIDGDQILADISAMVKDNPHLVLTGDQNVQLSLAAVGKVRGKREKFCKKAVSLAKSLSRNPDNNNILALVVCSVYNFIETEVIKSIVGTEVHMEDMLDNLSSGKYSHAIVAANTAIAEKARAEEDA
ncbi:MAG: hypothetical protein LBJ64_03020, partial [Deltaproteobacteria bacterium]|nr:hypothetical protein [Deltaproteobacteria bacterium]